MEKLVYSVNEVAKILDIGLNKAYELIHEKKIPFVKLGRKFIIPKKALEQWLENSV